MPFFYFDEDNNRIVKATCGATNCGVPDKYNPQKITKDQLKQQTQRLKKAYDDGVDLFDGLRQDREPTKIDSKPTFLRMQQKNIEVINQNKARLGITQGKSFFVRALSEVSGAGAEGGPLLTEDEFKQADKDGDGLISMEEIKNEIIESEGKPEDEAKEEAQELIEKVDTDGDGAISIQEFVVAVGGAGGPGGPAEVQVGAQGQLGAQQQQEAPQDPPQAPPQQKEQGIPSHVLTIMDYINFKFPSFRGILSSKFDRKDFRKFFLKIHPDKCAEQVCQYLTKKLSEFINTPPTEEQWSGMYQQISSEVDSQPWSQELMSKLKGERVEQDIPADPRDTEAPSVVQQPPEQVPPPPVTGGREQAAASAQAAGGPPPQAGGPPQAGPPPQAGGPPQAGPPPQAGGPPQAGPPQPAEAGGTVISESDAKNVVAQNPDDVFNKLGVNFDQIGKDSAKAIKKAGVLYPAVADRIFSDRSFLRELDIAKEGDDYKRIKPLKQRLVWQEAEQLRQTYHDQLSIPVLLIPASDTDKLVEQQWLELFVLAKGVRENMSQQKPSGDILAGFNSIGVVVDVSDMGLALGDFIQYARDKGLVKDSNGGAGGSNSHKQLKGLQQATDLGDLAPEQPHSCNIKRIEGDLKEIDCFEEPEPEPVLMLNNLDKYYNRHWSGKNEMINVRDENYRVSGLGVGVKKNKRKHLSLDM